MIFTEFLVGMKFTEAADLLQQVEISQPFNELYHNTYQKRLRHFLIIDGVPESIEVYRETQSYLEVERTKHGINSSYQADFYKY